MTEVAYSYVIVARQLATHHNYKKAFEMYMCGLQIQPRIITNIEFEFRTVLSRINEQLAAGHTDNKSQIFANYERVLKMFPSNVELLNDIGRYLYRYGYYCESLCHFEKALNLDSSSVDIEKNLNNTKGFLFPRNGFRILNDKVRNDAFRRAIKSSVTSVMDSVLDINGGTGLLALYANECKPLSVTVCEPSTTMARLAECVMQDNDAQEVIIINKPSVVLNFSDIYGTRSLLLTDLVDSALLGEYILHSLYHAWENLLQETSRVIPGRAEYFVAGVKCQDLNRKYKLCTDTKDILNVTNLNVHTTTYYDETYYGEDVHLYEDIKYMTEPQSVFTIDFNNFHDICDKLHRQEPYIAELTAIEDGDINMVVGWFNLHLTDDITITTDPRSEDKVTAWQQAVFFDVLPKKLRKNESMSVSFITYGGKVATLPEPGVAIERIPPEALGFLNDVQYMDMIKKSVGAAYIHLGQTVEFSLVDIVDLSPFPIFGVLMMKRGANSLICQVRTREETFFLKKVLQANDIPEQKVTILFSEMWSHKVFKCKKFHVIFSNIIDFSGDLDARRTSIVHHLKHAHLAPGGICLPAEVTVMGQLINSHFLEVNNRVLDENVACRMAKHVNNYQVTQALHVDIERTEYTPLSEVFTVGCCSNMRSEVINVPVTQDGECNAVLCWYKVQLLEGWNEVYTNRSNSFVESMAYMAPNIKMFYGEEANVLNCVDHDGSFKLCIDVEL